VLGLVKKFKKFVSVPKQVILSTYDDLFILANKEKEFSSIIFQEIKSITKKTKIRPNKLKKMVFCNKCGALFETPPRIKRKSLVLTCPNCGHINRKKAR